LPRCARPNFRDGVLLDLRGLRQSAGNADPGEDADQPGQSVWRDQAAIERALHWYDAYGLRSVALRYFNAAGADPDGEIGEEHDPETHLIPVAMRAALGHAGPLHIFGSDYPTRDGTAVRDYIHVADLAAAHVAALDY
jgi:UDP-glucose 4-epimerase